MKKTIYPILLILLPAVIMLQGCAALKGTGGKGFPLVYKFTPGQSMTIETASSSVLNTEQMGQTMKVDLTGGNVTNLRALEARSDGSVAVEMEISAMTQKVSSPMGEQETDFSPWIGKKVGFDLYPQGKSSNTSGFDKLVSITAATGETVTGEIMKRTLGNIFFELPANPVKKGDTWTVSNSMDVPMGGSTLKQEETTVYTVDGKARIDDREYLKIKGVGTEKLSGNLQQQGMDLELTRETVTNSVVYFDLARGMYSSVEFTSAGQGDIYVPAASVTVHQVITSSGKVTVKFN